MDIALVLLIILIIYIVWYAHTHNENNTKRAVSYPGYMNKNTKPYYNWCEDFLLPYLNTEFAKKILISAKQQLIHDYKEYKSLKSSGAKDVFADYYYDMFEPDNYPGYVYRAWAIIYIHYNLNMPNQYTMTLLPPAAERKCKNDFTDYIDSLYNGIVEDGTACPNSFIETFS